jgi:hypothetical protein
MKRFFTKKSVALIFATVLIVGCFGFKFVNAASSITSSNGGSAAQNGPTKGQTYFYTSPDDGHTDTFTYDGSYWNVTDSSISSDINNPDMRVDTTGLVLTYHYSQSKGGIQDDSLATENKVTDIFGNALNYVIGAGTLTLFGPIILAIFGWTFVIFALMSTILALTGGLFSASLNFSILHINDLFTNLGVVSSLWTMMRDIINITFIFILLYIAITKILSAWNAKTKTTIVNVIISAVLINFSMMIAKVIIDAGNMVAVEFYKQTSSVIGNTVSVSFLDISNKIMSATGLLEFIKSTLSLSGQLNMIITLVLQIILISILAWFYLYASIIFIGRVVMLMLLTITSPIGFIGGTFPAAKSFSDGWWKNLTEQVLVAPVFLFFMLLFFKIVENKTLYDLIHRATNPTLAAPAVDVSGYLYYILMMAVLIFGLKFTKSLSGKTGEWSVKILGTAALTAGAVITGGAMASVAGLQEVATGGKFGESFAASGKKIFGSATKFAKGNYDNMPGVAGWAARTSRGYINTGVKNMTGGTVDLHKITTGMEKQRNAGEKYVLDEANEKERKTSDALKENTNIEKNINTRIGDEVKNLPKDQRLVNAEADRYAKKKDMEQKQTVSNSVRNDKSAGVVAKTQAQSDFEQAKTQFSKADKIAEDLLKQYETQNKDHKREAAERIAKESGVIGDAIKDAYGNVLKDKQGNIIRESWENKIKNDRAFLENRRIGERQERFEKATNIENKSPFMGYIFNGVSNKEDAKKLANKVRALSSDKKTSGTDKDAFKKFAESQGMKVVDDKGEDKNKDKDNGAKK